ncbi:alpha/beta hydrolase [Silicimonas algicola]|uniref:Dienelactone hydrolase n=1 Tax=Silicimonas algicola TaxID=1826607 RepID=A0A316FZP2_9RHOB|nr:dienelactone hydrolase family protein [Silicimonas algicola]AZQ66714.1 alpha/beta hydrolase [Silicimonas algicola]PWK53176.1 dienelactone hydrolase [Silicimonas algicola]
MEKPTIDTPNPLLLRDMLEPDNVETLGLCADLHLPKDGSGPWPGVVILDGLGGPKDSRERRYGRKLSEHGYASLVIDSFTTRNVGARGDVVRALRVSEAMMLSDAFTGLRYLAGRSDVDPDRIGVIGFSYGGMIAVLAAYEQLARTFMPDGTRFGTHVSYYGCSVPRLDDPATTGAPVTHLLGGWDRNVSIDRVGKIAEDLQRGGSESNVRIFDEVYHQWDGEDETRRFFPLNLRRLRFRIGSDGVVRDERTGLRMNSRAKRLGLISLWIDPTGYSMLRDDETTKRSDEILLAALSAM